MQINKQKIAGFTLIEILVTIAIITTILGLGMANIEGRSQARNLSLSEQNFVSDLHLFTLFEVCYHFSNAVWVD